MEKVKKIKIRPQVLTVLKVIGIFLCVLLGIFLFYRKEINSLKKMGYSEKSSNNILFSFKKEYVSSIEYSDTLNRAFSDSNYKEEYLENYRKISYVDHKNLIKNINALIKKGYSNNDISIILKHGSDDAVTNFSKRDKVKYLEEFFLFDFAKIENYDRYVSYSNETGEDDILTVLYVNLDLDKEDYTDPIKVNKFSLDMLVNKHRLLDSDFVPDDLVNIDSKYASSDDLECSRLAYNAFIKMYNDASKEGYQLVINSAYRSYEDQEELKNYYLKEYGENYVNKYVALPGSSEHQTGLAFDIGSRNNNVFASSSEYQWMLDNAYKYGFILRFTKPFEFITGFRSEPWHFRYVGEKIAKEIHEDEMSLEEYYAVNLDK